MTGLSDGLLLHDAPLARSQPGQLDPTESKDGPLGGAVLDPSLQISLTIVRSPLGEDGAELGDVSIAEEDETFRDPFAIAKARAFRRSARICSPDSIPTRLS